MWKSFSGIYGIINVYLHILPGSWRLFISYHTWYPICAPLSCADCQTKANMHGHLAESPSQLPIAWLCFPCILALEGCVINGLPLALWMDKQSTSTISFIAFVRPRMLILSRLKNFPVSYQINKMINAKRFIKLVRKWKKLAALSRKRITLPTTGKVCWWRLL